jgi:hypothetical protein
MGSSITILVSDDIRRYINYLQQHSDDITMVGPKEFSPYVEILVIPSVNVFSGFEDRIQRNPGNNIVVDTFAREFYENTLQRYIENGTKILALGNSADMLWHALGGSLKAEKSAEGLSSVLGLYETSPLSAVNPRLGNEKTFQLTDYFEDSNFELIERPKTLIPIAWKSDLSRAEYKQKVNSATYFENFNAPIVAFEHISERIYGVKSSPIHLNHKFNSEALKYFGYKQGGSLTNIILKHLLTNGKGYEPAAIPVQAG